MWLEKLNQMKKESKKTIEQIAMESGVPKGTLNKLFSGQTKDPQYATLKAVVYCLGYTVDELDRSQPRSQFSFHENSIIRKYRDLDSHGKKVVNVVLDAEHERCTALELSQEDEEDQNIIELDFPYQAASAGVGDYADDTSHEKLAVRLNENTRRADYLMRVNGDSMEPKYQDGDVLLVHSQPSVEEGEVGIFIINGDRLVKQQGAGELISLNPQYPNILLSESDSVYCKGKVIGVLSPEDIL